MKLIPRHRSHSRAKAPRIAISQAEITADLHYPASRERVADAPAPRRTRR